MVLIIKKIAMKEQLKKEFKTFLEMRNYAPTTIKTYLNVYNLYWRFCEAQVLSNPDFCKDKAPIFWFKYVVGEYGAGTFYNQSYSSLKLLYTYILKRDWLVYGILRPRRVQYYPELMSKADVDRLLMHTFNMKHKMIFLSLYATGLRINELSQLKLEDINPQTMSLRVRSGKGRKDRFIPIKQPFLDFIEQYRRLYEPVNYLFNGEKKGEVLTTRAMQSAFQSAKKRAKLNPKVTPHTLRHAFATHHLDEGAHLPALKSMLGHTNIKTTSRYLHMTVESLHQFNNPSDSLCTKHILLGK